MSRGASQSVLLMLRIVLILSALLSAAAQDNPTKQERPRRALPSNSEPQDVIKIDTDLVPIDVIVTDEKGRLVRNLRKEDFKLFEDGVERPIASFNVEKVEGAARPVAIPAAQGVGGQFDTPRSFELVEATIPELQAALTTHFVNSKQLVKLYLDRFAAYGATLNPFITA